MGRGSRARRRCTGDVAHGRLRQHRPDACCRCSCANLGVPPERITVVTADGRGREIAAALGAAFHDGTARSGQLSRGAGRRCCGRADFLLNLSVEVASLELLRFASEPRRPLSRHRHRALARWLHRSRALARPSAPTRPFARGRWLCAGSSGPGTPTAVICQGANPGLVSQLVKAAGLELARALGLEPCEPPVAAEDWARLFRRSGHPHDPDLRA